ncbi:uncharacterized protein BO66DRAFT_225372 [Aspergillus aculeatinus CBS 121060]|uniref:Uncharacterized protein n=1 Tax=Aspergillus aculeatinus CBS 121060 TaxID=1448322 RepID=A0ACD1HIP4_9EURO|nr:hypothetical protein BO66DRAFT_225372 [Aspergillus aculeatinus CBS 121060]RAH73537.1 hypothetical protein BO66DRAFT_225372 [Aspergillus aculeatinus CBS 121060]
MRFLLRRCLQGLGEETAGKAHGESAAHRLLLLLGYVRSCTQIHARGESIGRSATSSKEDPKQARVSRGIGTEALTLAQPVALEHQALWSRPAALVLGFFDRLQSAKVSRVANRILLRMGLQPPWWKNHFRAKIGHTIHSLVFGSLDLTRFTTRLLRLLSIGIDYQRLPTSLLPKQDNNNNHLNNKHNGRRPNFTAARQGQ